MVQTTTRIVQVPSGTEIPVGVHSDTEVKQILQDLTQQAGTRVVSSPTVLARPGETAQVVIEATINNNGDQAIARGRQLNLSGHLSGFQLGSTLGSAMTETSNGQTFTTREVTRSFTGQAGHWFITRTEPQADGTTEYIFSQSNTVNVAEQQGTTLPPGSPDSPIESPLGPTPLALPSP